MRVRLAWVALLSVSACGGDSGPSGPPDARCGTRLAPTGNADTDTMALKEALINATAGQVVCLDDGTFKVNDALTIATPDVTLLGTFAGRKAVLDFSDQAAGGGKSVDVSADGFTAENFVVKNTPGDGMTATSVDHVTYRNVKVTWDGEPSQENGAYGIFPVGCDHVLIEDSEVFGASDAGIYVGQSQNVIVRRNLAHGNVAGIEIEVTSNAEVYENEATDNTGGILVFNLPNLPTHDGVRTRVFDNHVHANNRVNFAMGGTIVALVPDGLGIIVLANDQVEIHGNTITDHKSVGIAIAAYNTIISADPGDPLFDFYPTSLYIHDNTFARNGTDPQTLVKVVTDGCGRTNEASPGADIAWDGRLDPALPDLTPGDALCVQGTATFLMFDDANGYANCSMDLAPHDCTLPSLPPLPESWD
jgi:parallel beta-helix repeat protein